MQAPEWFLKLLRDTDPKLVAYWNGFKSCWMIDRKTDDGQFTNVLTCKAPNGDPLPLNENIIERIRSMDAWKKFGSYEAFHQHNINMAAEDERKRNEKIREDFRNASLDDKAQLHKAYDLIQRHDMRVNQ
jgi:hypothetical protein